MTEGYKGKAPDIGAYEFGDTHYWIPGRQEKQAAMPIPVDKHPRTKVDTDLMYLIGLKGVKASVYLGQSEDSLALVATQNHPENIVNLPEPLQPSQTYFWRVDTEDSKGRIAKGKVWSFTTQP